MQLQEGVHHGLDGELQSRVTPPLQDERDAQTGAQLPAEVKAVHLLGVVPLHQGKNRRGIDPWEI